MREENLSQWSKTLLLPDRYGTYKLVQKMPGGENMVGFTRILHRTTPDAVMDEVRYPENYLQS